MKISGVYSIFCSGNNKTYIGSSVDINTRKRKHFEALRRGKHVNKHLQNTYSLYGEATFNFSILETCLPGEVLIREQEWLDVCKPELNNSPTATNRLGFRHSEETIQKLKARILPPISQEARLKMSISRKGRQVWNKGIPMADDVKLKVSKKQKGISKIYSDDIIEQCQLLRDMGATYVKIASALKLPSGSVPRLCRMRLQNNVINL